MNCPHCGTDTPIGAGRCAKCGALQSPPTVATGVLTPPSVDINPALHDLSAFETIAPGSAGPEPEPTIGGVPFDITRAQPAAAGDSMSTGGFSRAMGGTPAGGPPPTYATGSPAKQMPMLAAGQTLGTRYHIIRLLGIGGMGAVYHAWDAELGVAVALKVIRADVTSDPGTAAEIERQFKRELLLARQVTHKHVVRIHDLGDIDGIKYITMPYVQGADLSTILKQAGKLPIPRALTYVRQIVDGLVAAHEAGVVHRDLKPANIMIDEEDQALIMDFGIAHSSSKNTGSGAAKVVGTLAYMAPEQAQAKPTDQRADVYALGMMLREMLVGRTMGDGQQAVAELMQRIKEAPPNLRAIDADIPEPLDALAARCVQPDPANRFQTSAELAQALAALDENGHLRPVVKPVLSPWRMAAAAVVVVATVGVAAVVVRRAGPAVPPKPIEPISVLVADFVNNTGDAVFDGALEQPLTIAMEGASYVATYARTDAQRVAQQMRNAPKLDPESARLVAFREGVKYVLAGTVSSSGGKYTLQVDAIDPAAGKVVQSATATAATKGDVLTAVGSVAAKVRGGMSNAKGEQAPAMPAETFTAASFDAMREYSLAQDLQSANDDAALAHYRRAIELDPKFGRAYSGAANVSHRLGRRDEAEQLWKQSLSMLDRMTAREKYRTLGAYYLAIPQNYDQGIDNFRKLVSEYPADAAGHTNLALAYFYALDFPKALEAGKRARDLFPKNTTTRNNYALFAMYAGDFARGAAEAKALLADQPAFFRAHLPIAIEAFAKGDVPAAIAAYDEMTKEGPRAAAFANMARGDLALYAGRVDAARFELMTGLTADVEAKSTMSAALKQVALAEAEAEAGRKTQAADAARAALKMTRAVAVSVPAARVLLRAGKADEARAIAAGLEGHLQKQDRAYGKILLAEAALAEKKFNEAIDLLTQARQFADLWLGRFDLGVAYVQAGHFAEAVSELEACEKRRGEATALFFNDVPTVRYLATLPYWIGRAQEGLNIIAPAKTRYENFLTIRKDAAADPLVLDARRRAAER